MIKRTSIVFLAASILVACQSDKSKNEETIAIDSVSKPSPTSVAVGGDKDEHGCIASAGYTWSPVKNECIRIFEQTQLRPLTNPDASVAFLLFNNDKTKAELFVPEQKQGIVLERTGSDGNYVWKKDSLEIVSGKGYTVRIKDKSMYHGG